MKSVRIAALFTMLLNVAAYLTFTVLLVLKLTGGHMNWLWVTSPLWLCNGLGLVIYVWALVLVMFSVATDD